MRAIPLVIRTAWLPSLLVVLAVVLAWSPPATVQPEAEPPGSTGRPTAASERSERSDLLRARRESGESQPGGPDPSTAQVPATEPVAKMPVGHFVLGPARKLPVTLAGLDQVPLRLFRITPRDAHHVFDILGAHPPSRDPLSELPIAVARDEVTLRLQPMGPTYAESELDVDVFRDIAGDLVLAVLEGPDATRVALVERGRLAVVFKSGESDGLVWVTDTEAAAPVGGAQVTIAQGRSLRWTGKTDARGIVRLPARKSLKLDPAVHSEDAYQPLSLFAEHAGHAGLANERWSTGIEPWQFDVPYRYYGGSEAFSGMVTAERGIYRPAEHVHVLGVLRARGKTGALSVPDGAADIAIHAPDGSVVFNQAVQLTAFGTFHAEVALGRHAALGGYRIVAQRGETSLYGHFEVGEYRTARYEVTFEDREGAGAPNQASLQARYLYGAPVKAAAVAWTASVRAGRGPVDGFSYGPDDHGQYWDEVASGKATSDDAGRTRLSVDMAAVTETLAPALQVYDVAFEATVTDAAGDSITARKVSTQYRSASLVGVKSNDWIVDPKRGWSVDVKLVGAGQRAPAAADVKLELVRRHWASVARVQGGRTVYESEWKESVVQRKTVRVGGAKQVLRLALPGGGTYQLRAALAGSQAYAETSVWAYGGGAYGGGTENDARMEVRADKAGYDPGDEAKLLVASPYREALALVTVEREGVLSARTLRLSSGEAVPVTIRESYLPGVYASVAVVPVGLGQSAPASGIPLRVGYTKLEVSPEARRLSVDLKPDRLEHRPGDAGHVAVRVRDARGQPVRAEVTLWAADEGVLLLTGYRTPSAFEAAYRDSPLSVHTATNLVRWYQPGQQDDGSGGDYGEEGTALRSRFLSTAFFAKPVVTDANGRARVKFDLPDNLTRWRLMASVADAKDRFGSAETSVLANKPVQAMPALPRFLTQGDEVRAAVLVHNQTGKAGVAEVALDVAGARRVGVRRRRVKIGPHGQLSVPFRIEATDIGVATVTAQVRFGSLTDGFRVELPVHPATGWRTERVSSGTIGSGAALALNLPADATPDASEVVVDVSAGLFASMGGAIDSLLEYPHGCVEQTTSRLIPLVQLERVLQSSGDPRLSSAQHRARMNAAVAHVLKHQNSDGGFGLWPTSDSESFLTAYALWGLTTARGGGYEVPERVTTRGFQYLKQHLGADEDMHGQFSDAETAPFAAYVMARSGQSHAVSLPEKAEQPSRFSQGLVSVALGEGTEKALATRNALLTSLFKASSPLAKGGALIKERGDAGDLFFMGRDVRATSAAVEALVASGRADEAEPLIAGVLASRERDGSWGTTYNNLWALNALSAYATHRLEGLAEAEITVQASGEPAKAITVSKTQPLRQMVLRGASVFANGRTSQVTLAGPMNNSARYAARLRWVPDVRRQRPVSKGFSVSRTLVDAETGTAVAQPKVGQLVRIRIKVEAEQAGRQIAVQDFLPAGFEPVDTALRTSASASEDTNWTWSHRELHDERVTFFADALHAGTHEASYLARVTRPGEFLRPAARVEAMYDPAVYGVGRLERVTVEP